MVVECGAVADIGHPGVSFPIVFDDNGIDADFGAKLVMKVDVGGRDTQQFAAPVPAVGHRAADLVIAAQHLAGFVHPTVHDQLSDSRAADAIIVGPGRLDPVRNHQLKTQFIGVLPQQVHIAFAFVTEGVILPDNDGLHADPLHQDILDEGSCRHGGKLHGKRDTDQHVDAGFFDQLGFLLDKGNQGRMPVVGDDPDGMRLEGHGNGRAIHGISHFDHLVKKGLVAEVHTVEIANGDHGRFEGFFYGFDILYYFHDLSANRKNGL